MSIEDLLIEFIPFFFVPVGMAILSAIIRLMKEIAQGSIEIGERENEREENANDQKERINIDKDLQKYFNYKE